MNLALHLNLYLFPMILLTIIFILMQKNVIKTTDSRLFCNLLASTFCLLLSELFSWMLEGRVFLYARNILWGCNFIYFLLMPFVLFLWLNYVYYYLYQKFIYTVGRVRKLIITVIFGIYYFMLVMTAKTNWFYYIDENSFYHRGPFFYVPYMLAFVIFLMVAFVMTRNLLSEKVAFRKKQSGILCFYTVLPLIAAIVQVFQYDIWLALPITAIAELLVYVQIQQQQITLDALTGVNNRGCFEHYVKNQLELKKQSLYLFMMDLDCFKTINDTYGHAVGDEALKKAASVLSRFFYGSNAFLARFGGDEFCAVEVCQSEKEAEALMEQLQAAFAKWNQENPASYKLSISVGYTPLLSEKGQLTDIIRTADEMMYTNKRRRKNL